MFINKEDRILKIPKEGRIVFINMDNRIERVKCIS